MFSCIVFTKLVAGSPLKYRLSYTLCTSWTWKILNQEDEFYLPSISVISDPPAPAAMAATPLDLHDSLRDLCADPIPSLWLRLHCSGGWVCRISAGREAGGGRPLRPPDWGGRSCSIPSSHPRYGCIPSELSGRLGLQDWTPSKFSFRFQQKCVFVASRKSARRIQHSQLHVVHERS